MSFKTTRITKVNNKYFSSGLQLVIETCWNLSKHYNVLYSHRQGVIQYQYVMFAPEI